MSTGFFSRTEPIRYAGPESGRSPRLPLVRPGPEGARQAHGGPSPLRRLLLALLHLAGRRSRSAAQTFERPWFGDDMAAARLKADVAFEMFRPARRAVLHLPRPRHRAGRRDACRVEPQRARDRRDLRPRRWRRRRSGSSGARPTSSRNRRYMAGAATNPDPEVFAYAAAQVKNALDVTHELGGAELRAVGRPRGLRDAPQHRHEARARAARPLPHAWSSSTSTRSASRARS